MSLYKAISADDVGAIIGFEPKYHITLKIESLITYFPFNNQSQLNTANGTTGYFSVAAGSFIQEQNIEERLETIFGAVLAAGGTFGLVYIIYSIFIIKLYSLKQKTN